MFRELVVDIKNLIRLWFKASFRQSTRFNMFTGENLDAVTAVTGSFKMAHAFTGDRTGGAARGGGGGGGGGGYSLYFG